MPKLYYMVPLCHFWLLYKKFIGPKTYLIKKLILWFADQKKKIHVIRIIYSTKSKGADQFYLLADSIDRIPAKTFALASAGASTSVIK